MRTAAALLAAYEPRWGELCRHPFVTATADGSLPEPVFDRWLVEDHAYVVEFRRFLAALVVTAPDEPSRDVLAGGLGPLQSELDLFRGHAARRGLSLTGEPAPTTLGYSSFLHASVLDGFPVGLTVLFGAEKAYFDAWETVGRRAAATSPYRSFIDAWSSSGFGRWVDDLGRLLDAVSPGGPSEAQRRAFDRVLRFERRFWDAVYAGETW